MRILRRPSLYFLVVPFLGIAAGTLVHEAMGCGYECTGPVSGPIDRAGLFIAYLFGYGLPMFMTLAAMVFAGELLFSWLSRRAAASATPEKSTPDGREQDNKK